MAGANSGAPLAVYGEIVKVAPCNHGIPDSTFAWKDIKAYLPARDSWGAQGTHQP